jgi:hypothetical protein
MAAAACGRKRRLGDVETATWIHSGAGNVIPEAQLGERDAESVGDGDQRVAPARRVKNHVG